MVTLAQTSPLIFLFDAETSAHDSQRKKERSKRHAAEGDEHLAEEYSPDLPGCELRENEEPNDQSAKPTFVETTFSPEIHHIDARGEQQNEMMFLSNCGRKRDQAEHESDAPPFRDEWCAVPESN